MSAVSRPGAQRVKEAEYVVFGHSLSISTTLTTMLRSLPFRESPETEPYLEAKNLRVKLILLRAHLRYHRAHVWQLSVWPQAGRLGLRIAEA